MYPPPPGQASEDDLNGDGKADVITISARVQAAAPVYGVKALLQFTYKLRVRGRSTGANLEPKFATL